MKIPVAWCVLIAVVLTFLGSIGHIPTHNAPKAARVAWAVKKNLPAGSSRAQVIELLDAHGLEHSSDGAHAIVRSMGCGLFLETDLLFRFDFDERNSMTRYSAKLVTIGP